MSFSHGEKGWQLGKGQLELLAPEVAAWYCWKSTLFGCFC